MLTLHTFPDADAFLAHAREALEADEIGNSLMLGICLRMKERPERVKTAPYLRIVEDDSNPFLAAVMTPPHDIVLTHLGEDAQRGIDLLKDDLLAGEWAVPGVLAPSDLALAFAEAWTETTGEKYRLAMRERLHALREVRLAGTVAPGHLRPATAQDLDVAADWFHAFWQEAMGEVPQSGAREPAQQRISDGDLFIWEDEGRPVSMALKTRPTRHTISITGVYTPPALRRRGYATACVAELSRRLLAEGYTFCALHTDLANPTSNHIYYEIGYRPLSDFDKYVFESD